MSHGGRSLFTHVTSVMKNEVELGMRMGVGKLVLCQIYYISSFSHHGTNVFYC